MTREVPPLPTYTRRSLELRAAKYYASIRKPEKEWKALADLAPQLAEFEHQMQAENYDDALSVLSSIALSHLFVWGYYLLLVEKCEKLKERLNSPHLKTQTLQIMNVSYQCLGYWEKIVELSGEAIVLARKTEDYDSESIWLGGLGRVYRILGETQKAIVLLEKAILLAHKAGNLHTKASWVNNLGLIYSNIGQFEKALELHQQALDISREAYIRQEVGYSLGHIGYYYYVMGDFDLAIGYYQESLEISRELVDRRSEGIRLYSLGCVYYARGEIARAVECHQSALSIMSDIHEQRWQSYALLELGRIYLYNSDINNAIFHFTQARSSKLKDVACHALIMLRICQLCQSHEVAHFIFDDCILLAEELTVVLNHTYRAHHILGTALVGRAVCDPRWIDPNQRTDLLAPALAEYRRALDITSAPGTVRDALHDLDLIRAAGIEGLEPVIGLLEGVLNEHS